MTSEKYLMMLKEDDLQKQVKIKAALERKAQVSGGGGWLKGGPEHKFRLSCST